MTIRAMIVEDEPGARKRLVRLLAAEHDVQLVGECDDGGTAVAMIFERRPDLVFLDIQLPTLSGLEVLARMDQQRGPRVVFTTAYDKYALTAFDAAAVDYLLKPFTAARFTRAMARARERLTANTAALGGAELEELLRDVRRGQEAVHRMVAGRTEPQGRMVIRNGDRMPVVRHADIEYVESDGNYVKLHAGTVTHRFRGTIQGFLEELDARQFARVHRGTIVNLERVREVQPWYSGDFVLVMQSGAKLRLSRTYNNVLRWFGMRSADIESPGADGAAPTQDRAAGHDPG